MRARWPASPLSRQVTPAQTTSGHAWIPRFLAETLVDPYSTVRYISGRSLKTLPGYTDFPYDYIAPAAQRTEARLRALDLWRGQPASAERNAILKQSAPMLQEDKVDALLRQRDNRLMELLE